MMIGIWSSHDTPEAVTLHSYSLCVPLFQRQKLKDRGCEERTYSSASEHVCVSLQQKLKPKKKKKHSCDS